jgi:hypothetical protein
MFAAAAIGFAGVTSLHLARLRHQSYLGPVSMLLLGGIFGIVTVVIAYRDAEGESGRTRQRAPK